MASEKDDDLTEAREDYERHVAAAQENHDTFKSDFRFGRLAEQWPEEVAEQRKRDKRPMLTIPKLAAFQRQVVNDARMNKPSIKVLPVDSGADPETADIINGLFRNIEATSDADVAYDTGAECAVGGGFGFWKVDLEYACDDTVGLDIKIKRVANPLSIYGDPDSEAADSSDWMSAYEIEAMRHADFERQYGKDRAKIDWGSYLDGVKDKAHWGDDKHIFILKRWRREKVKRKAALLVRQGERQLVDAAKLKEPDILEAFRIDGWEVVRDVETQTYRVTRQLMTGAEILPNEEGETEEKWPGIYIPIIPVYGDEVNIEGKRYFRSLIHDAIDAQRMFNYWRTAATELVALAPRVPYIGPKGAFKSDARKWATANSANHPYLEFDGAVAPQRQPLDTGAAAGALQEALNASDDMKAIMGLYDASLGARSNETSGKAIMARQREGDTSTFHFLDNVTRAIRHTGRVILDLIPKVYNEERIIRVLGEDGKAKAVPLKQPVPVMDENGKQVMEPVTDEMGNPMMDPATGQPATRPKTRIYDLTLGKYDLTVKAGPSFTTRREEAAAQMTELIRAFPPAAPVLADLLARQFDWPEADEVAKRLEELRQGGVPPEVQKMIQDLQATLQKMEAENAALKNNSELESVKLELEREKIANERLKLVVSRYEAETDRIEALKPEPPPQQNTAQGQF